MPQATDPRDALARRLVKDYGGPSVLEPGWVSTLRTPLKVLSAALGLDTPDASAAISPMMAANTALGPAARAVGGWIKELPGFYSRLTRAMEGLPAQAHPSKVMSVAKNLASQEEIELRKLPEFLASHGNTPINREAVLVHLDANPPVFEDGRFVRGTLLAEPITGAQTVQQAVTAQTLADYIGKDAAERLTMSPTRVEGRMNVLEGDDLAVGGEGMRAFYDNLLPKRLQKIVSSFGGTVGQDMISTPRREGVPELGITEAMFPQTTSAWITRLSPEMKAAILKRGLPLMSLSGLLAGAEDQ